MAKTDDASHLPTGDITTSKPVEAAMNPAALAAIKRAAGRWRKPLRQKEPDRKKSEEDRELVSSDGRILTERFKDASVQEVARLNPDYLRTLLDQPAAMNPTARRRALIALAAAKRGLIGT